MIYILNIHDYSVTATSIEDFVFNYNTDSVSQEDTYIATDMESIAKMSDYLQERDNEHN